MAAKSKKRLSKIDNKLLKLDELELKDVICSICQSILIEPVTLPCFHDFCYHCFNGSIENNALSCPLCRLRIGSWLRKATKQKNLVNVQLWDFIKTKFSEEIDVNSKGADITLPEEIPTIRLSNPGEIRFEYEAELKRLETERLKFEAKHFEETNLLIKKIQHEEEEDHKKYLERLEEDERLALQMQKDHLNSTGLPQNTPRDLKGIIKPKLKAVKIDSFLSRIHTPKVNDSLIHNDGSKCENSSMQKITTRLDSNGSPEMIPKYGKFMTILDKKKFASDIWNKENGKKLQEKVEEATECDREKGCEDKTKIKNKSLVPSLLVSLPLPCSGIRIKKKIATETRTKETGSADSMQQELCYFKPIDGNSPISFNNTCKDLPIKVPSIRIDRECKVPNNNPPPARAQYLEELCNLRKLSLSKNLPSAFVIALNILQVKKDTVKCETNLRPRARKTASSTSNVTSSLPARRKPNRSKLAVQVDGITTLSKETNLRRTRSMGSIPKDDNETTPKKAKIEQRKVSSERKRYLRSNSKRLTMIHEESPVFIPESINNNKLNMAVKNLSSPLKSCDVKQILEEQLRIEKIIEQEKNDFELAQKIEAEWNGRRQPRRTTMKRQVTLNHSLRPAKKLKV